MDGIRYLDIRKRLWKEVDFVDQSILNWFGHIKRMEEGRFGRGHDRSKR